MKSMKKNVNKKCALHSIYFDSKINDGKIYFEIQIWFKNKNIKKDTN